ncbi:MAG TPA: hypothetical protein DCM62_03090 [Bacteroidales bacterium]|nr:hypothetical protein [Bacteroidales bacterium]
MQESPTLHIALPALNEWETLPATLDCIAKQTYSKIQTWICVNQPDSWWNESDKIEVCRNNQKTLAFLAQWKKSHLHIIDRASHGLGWIGKSHGVGQARKTIMDAIASQVGESDIIVSLDADTRFGSGYLESVYAIFSAYPKALALSNPYYHQLTGDEVLDRAMLRYEIYMRYYAINMWRISSPYCFTALGSAIAIPIWAYKKVGGLTAKKSGEDFYFLQKIRKAGWIAQHNQEVVWPATRYSDRVYFGTGPALIKGSMGIWNSYPIYDYKLFDTVGKTYDLFAELFHRELETPMSAFLNAQFGEKDIFAPLRANYKDPKKFIDACHYKIDGLRVLQFLKHHQGLEPHSDEENLMIFLSLFYADFFDTWENYKVRQFSFVSSPIALLNSIRDFLFEQESRLQQLDLHEAITPKVN